MKTNSIKLKTVIYVCGGALALLFFVLTARLFSADAFREGTESFFLDNPLILGLVTIAYLLSFIFRAAAWKIYLGGKVKLSSCLQAILLSLVVNHLAPLKIGDAFRIGLLCQKEKQIKADVSAHSVIVLRLLDMGFLLFITAAGLILMSKKLAFALPAWTIPAGAVILLSILFAIYIYFPAFFRKHLSLLKEALSGKRLILIAIFVLASWILEGTVVWAVARIIENPLTFLHAVWVNSITVGGQVFQITPGGIATYESIMTIALVSFQFPADKAYLAALISHGYKFLFSYAAGIFLLIFTPFQKLEQLRKMVQTRGNNK